MTSHIISYHKSIFGSQPFRISSPPITYTRFQQSATFNTPRFLE